MKPDLYVPFPAEDLYGLRDFLRENDDPRDPIEVLPEAVQYWKDNAGWKPELLRTSIACGFQWKNVFLPDQTELRMQYSGTYYYAKVEGDKLLFQGEPSSPSEFANRVGGKPNKNTGVKEGRNAWRDIWIRRPNDAEWAQADELRQRQHDEIEKLLQLGRNLDETSVK